MSLVWHFDHQLCTTHVLFSDGLLTGRRTTRVTLQSNQSQAPNLCSRWHAIALFPGLPLSRSLFISLSLSLSLALPLSRTLTVYRSQATLALDCVAILALVYSGQGHGRHQRPADLAWLPACTVYLAMFRGVRTLFSKHGFTCRKRLLKDLGCIQVSISFGCFRPDF